jgi:hypothetical protein
VGRPPAGDGVFDQIDIIAALRTETYLTGPYKATEVVDHVADGNVSIGYNAESGEIWTETSGAVELTSINICSLSGVFTAQAPDNLGGAFDIDTDSTIFKATFGGNFGSLSFGDVAKTGLSAEYVMSDITVMGSTAEGRALEQINVIYVPEPTAWLLALFALVSSVAGPPLRRRPPGRC